MVKLIPARVENGYVVPLLPLPETSEFLSVSILVELGDRQELPTNIPVMDKWYGVLKEPAGNYEEEYLKYLEEKYR